MSMFQGHEITCIRGRRMVFAGLGFAVPAGGALILLGPNGSGKSSLLRLMAGLGQPADGHISWAGNPITQDPEAHRVRLRYAGHLDCVKAVLSVRENLSFWAGQYGAAEAAAVNRGLAAFALESLADMPGQILSAGQKHRLALARLAASPGELWLLDEPTVGLDSAAQTRLTSAIAAHRDTGGRVVAATHTPLDMPGAQSLNLTPFAEAARDAEAQADADLTW